MRVLCLFLFVCPLLCVAQDPAPTDKPDTTLSSNSTGQVTQLRSQLATSNKLIDVLEDEVSRMEAIIKEKNSHIDLLKAQVEREQKVGKFQKSLNEFQEKQIAKLREVVQELKAQQKTASH